MSNLEEAKKSFIKDSENFEEQELLRLIERINKICVLDKKGHVSFIDTILNNKEKVKFILVARFLANKLDNTIQKEVSNDELEKMLKVSSSQIRARVSDLRKEDVIRDLSRDIHEINPLQVHKLLKNE